MREPQEIERLGLTQTPCRPVPGGVRPELDQPGFVRVQRQPELRQPLAKIGQQSLRVGLVLETHDEVVREADDDHITVRLVTSPPCHPQVQDVVQVNVGDRRAARSHAGAPAAAQRRGRTSLTPASGGRSSRARKGRLRLDCQGSCAGSRCVAGGVISQAPIRRRPVAGGCHDHVSGTGLLSQMIERGAGAGSCRKGERARGLATLPSSRPPRRLGRAGGLHVGQQVPGAGQQLAGDRDGGDLLPAALGDGRVGWRRTPGTAWRSAPPGSAPTAARPSPAWRCARAGRSGPSRGPSA